MWVFKLYDVDNAGVIDVDEMAKMMETLEALEFTGGPKRRGLKDEARDLNPDSMTMSARQRAANLFQALDVNEDGLLTMEEFVAGNGDR